MNRFRFAALVLVAGSLLTTSPALADVIYTANFTGAIGTQPTGFSAFADPGMVSQNDGANEYEQERMSANGVAVAYYSTADDIDRADWRDVTVTTQTRFSGAGANQNGLVLRGRGITSTTSGDFYHVRMSGDSLELVRFNGGAGSILKAEPTTESISTAANRWLRVSVANVPQPNTDWVQVHAELSKTANFSQVIGTLDYVDKSTSAITRAGGVGYRSNNTVSSASRSVFDNLLAVNDNPDLLWYDDYADNTAPRMTRFLGGTRTQSVTSQKYGFDNTGAAIAFVDFPAETSDPQWAYTRTSAMMRLNTMGGSREEGGLIFRANGIDSAALGDGSYYLYRLRRWEDAGEYAAELLRHDDGGGLTLLGSVDIGSAGVPESQNIFLQVDSTPEPSGVFIRAMASLSPEFTNPIGLISFLDTSPDALFGPGTAGFRIDGGGAINFDNFTVMVIPEPASLILLGIGVVVLLVRRKRHPERS